MICPYCADPKTTDGYPTKVTDTRRFFDDVRRRFYMERKRVNALPSTFYNAGVLPCHKGKN